MLYTLYWVAKLFETVVEVRMVCGLVIYRFEYVFQFIRVGGTDVALLAPLCAAIVEYWNDLAVYYGTHRPNVTSELRLVTPLVEQIFDDAMMRPRFAVLPFILDLR